VEAALPRRAAARGDRAARAPRPDTIRQGHFNILPVRGPSGRGVKLSATTSDIQARLPSEMALLNSRSADRHAAPVIDATAITACARPMTAIARNTSRRRVSRVLATAGAGTAYGTCAFSTALRFRRDRVTRAGRERTEFGAPSPRPWQGRHGHQRLGIVRARRRHRVEASRLPKPGLTQRNGSRRAPSWSLRHDERGRALAHDIMDKMVVDDWGQCEGLPFGALRMHAKHRLTAGNLHASLGRSSPEEALGRAATKRGFSSGPGLSITTSAGHALLAKGAATAWTEASFA